MPEPIGHLQIIGPGRAGLALGAALVVVHRAVQDLVAPRDALGVQWLADAGDVAQRRERLREERHGRARADAHALAHLQQVLVLGDELQSLLHRLQRLLRGGTLDEEESFCRS